MAIAGFLVQVLTDHLEQVRVRLADEPGLNVHGTQEGQYIVLVAELPSSQMEGRVKAIEAWQGVLAVYTTYLSVEDELLSGEGGGS